MKQLFTLMALTVICNMASAQKETDSIRVGNMVIVTNGEKKPAGENQRDTGTNSTTADTIRVGNILIARNGKKSSTEKSTGNDEYWEERNRKSNVSTNWIILDIGFSNYINNSTNYNSGGGYLYNRAGAAPLGKNDFELNTGKSINVNIWLFMQRLNLINHHLHLKYGLGIELNNYRFNSQLSFAKQNPFANNLQAPAPTIFRDSLVFSKNKLATDYFTVPFMLNYSTNPYNQHRGFSVSVGVSAGYLYSQRNKQVSSERGTQKTSGGIGVEQFKFSYVAEIGLGPVRLYGSYSPNTMFKNQLDIRPYTLGVRLSNW